MINSDKSGEDQNLIERAKIKEKFSIEHQADYLELKGIRFEKIKRDEVIQYLSENNYYYKLTAYRKNFLKDSNNKYTNLDFAHLKELAILDMHLRHFVIATTLDLEHILKHIIIDLITKSDYDGYKIVKEYDDYNERIFLANPRNAQKAYFPASEIIMSTCKGYRKNYIDLYDKRRTNPAIWVLIELMSYGQLRYFIDFYVQTQKFGSTILKQANNCLFLSKNARDVAAHNRPIISDIAIIPGVTSNNLKPVKIPIYLKNFIIPKIDDYDKYSKYLTNPKIIDLISVLYLIDSYCKGGMRIGIKRQIDSFMTRCIKNSTLFIKHDNFIVIYELFAKIIVYL